MSKNFYASTIVAFNLLAGNAILWASHGSITLPATRWLVHTSFTCTALVLLAGFLSMTRRRPSIVLSVTLAMLVSLLIPPVSILLLCVLHSLPDLQLDDIMKAGVIALVMGFSLTVFSVPLGLINAVLAVLNARSRVGLET